MSRILVWSPNYAPELTGIPPLVTDACEWLAGRGHEVEVVTALPNYPDRRIDPAFRGKLWCSERRGGVTLHRSWLRVRPGESFLDKALYEASFAAFSLPNVLRRLRWADVVVCVVPSLLAPTLAATLPRRPRLALWLQDLVLAAALSIDGIGPAARRGLAAARRLERLAARRADRIVTCSPGFADYLEGLGIERSKIGVVLNWVDTDWILPARAAPNGRTRFLYAGNFGYTQGFETLFEALRACVAKLGIPAERHFVRPLARRGYATEGIEVTAADLEPEVTVSVDGVYWHPLACEDDLLVTRRLFPFVGAMDRLHEMYHTVLASGALPQKFR